MTDRRAGPALVALALVLVLLAFFPAAEGLGRMRNLLLAGALGAGAAGISLWIRGRDRR